LFQLFEEWFIGDALSGIPAQDAIYNLINSRPFKALIIIFKAMIYGNTT
jgi:hypothetical protein